MMNKFAKTTLSIATVVFGLGLASSANADAVRFNNLNATTVDGDALSTYGPIAGSFSTAEYRTTLTQLSFKLSGTPDNGSVSIQLLSDASTSPGSVLNTIASLNDSVLGGSFASYTFTPATTVGLAANTRYWIRLASNNSSARWAWSGDISGPGVAREYISNVNGTFSNASEAPYQMQVSIAAPEPSSYALLGLGILGLVGPMLRNRSRERSAR